MPSGTAETPVLGSGCTLATEGDYKCEVFEDVEGSCDAFLPDLIDSLYTSIWLCCAGALVSGLLGTLGLPKSHESNPKRPLIIWSFSQCNSKYLLNSAFGVI